MNASTSSAAPARLFCYGDHGLRHEVVSLAEALCRRGFPRQTLKMSDGLSERLDSILVGWSDTYVAPFVQGDSRHYCGGPVLFTFPEVKAGRDGGFCKFVACEYAIRVDTTHDQWGTVKVTLELVAIS